MLKVFISYSHKDAEYKKLLDSHLQLLAKKVELNIWSDNELIAGQEWHPEILENLEKSQVIILLLSVDFLNSKFCSEKEMLSALDMHNSNRAVVIPVVIRPIPENDYPFNKIQALPPVAPGGTITNVRAMTLWGDFDLACVEVCQGIEQAINYAKTGLLKDINNADINFRSDRITDAIEEGDISKACDLLMQYCTDFSPHNLMFRWRATAIKGAWNSLVKAQKDSGDERIKTIMEILTLMDEVRREPLKAAA